MRGLRILVISDHYPPYHSGGYEIRVKNIMDDLSGKGFVIEIITSKPDYLNRNSDRDINYPVIRKLNSTTKKNNLINRIMLHPSSHHFGLLLALIRQIFLDIHDLRIIDHQIIKFQPELIYLGNILPLTKNLLPFLAETKLPVILDDGGATLPILQEDKGIWFKFIEKLLSNNKFLNIAKLNFIRIVGLISKHKIKSQWVWPDNLNVMFKREENYQTALRKMIPIHDKIVLPSGIDTQLFTYTKRQQVKFPVCIVYPARIEPRKGQLDAIRLVAKLLDNGIQTQLFLLGEIRKSYFFDLQQEVSALHIEDYIQFVPLVSQNELVTYYKQAGICFFPSYWKDGLSRVPMEAMACGCIVISYGNEGSYEIVRDRQNGFIVNPADYETLVKIVKELISTPELVRDITTQARKDIDTFYLMHNYIDQIQKFIYKVSG